MKSTKRILTEARDLIAEEGRWCQGEEAMNVCQSSVDALSPEATCWCSYGAIVVAASTEKRFSEPQGWAAVVSLSKAMGSQAMHPGGSKIVDFNDSSTHEEVVAAFNKAIDSCNDD